MKFTPVSLLVGGAGLVAAVPMRLVVVEHIGPVPAPRIGFAGSGAFHGTPEPAAFDLKAIQEPEQHNSGISDIFTSVSNDEESPFAPTFIQDGPKRHGCGKNKGKNIIMAKMDDFSKFFRKLFGFDLIEEFHPPMPDYVPERHRMHPPPLPAPTLMSAHVGSPDEDNNEFHILPFKFSPTRDEALSSPPSLGANAPLAAGPAFPPHPSEFRGRHRMWMHRHRPHSFFGRLHKALLTLSPWEGRALSFVVGCGIGVLLRMLYVFTVLAYRCFFAQPRVRLEERQEEEPAPAVDGTAEQQPLIQAPPPEYEYNEKVEPQ